MFIFLIALKSQKTSNNWQITTDLLTKTLASIQNQSNNNYKIVVVCNQIPDINTSSIDWVVTDLDGIDVAAELKTKEKDRASKLLIGFEYAKKYNPTYIMSVDADDFVSCEIVDYVLNHECNGYYLESGYIYEQTANLIFIDRGFKDYCGTSLILKPDIFLEYFNGGYYLHNQSKNLNKLPFEGAIYNRCTGDNFAATKPLIESMGRADPKFVYKPIADEIIKTFNFYRG